MIYLHRICADHHRHESSIGGFCASEAVEEPPMLNRIAHALKSLTVEKRDNRDLCRLDCRCLEDIGLIPRDVTSILGQSCHRLRHHPSWDADAGRPIGAASRRDD
jgi:uncharacterized protein YjiS (DUF1127 family)